MRALAKEHPVFDNTYGEDLYNLDNTWDADKIFGCKCDVGYNGFDCSLSTCPVGNDPTQEPRPVYESQDIQCTYTVPIPAASPTAAPTTTLPGVYLKFRQQTTARIAVTASAAEVKQALEGISTIDAAGLNIVYSTGATLCSSDACTGNSCNIATVTWLREGGDLPLLQQFIDPTHSAALSANVVVNIAESVKGTHIVATCSNKGTCDTSTGLCVCYPGWGSSDGFSGKLGLIPDCGYKISRGKFGGSFNTELYT
jgi:hypothetical protein